MSDAPESVVRGFLAAWGDYPKLDRPLSFLAEDAVFVDGPRGVHHGIDAIRSEFEAQASIGWGDLTIEVQSLVANGGTVMVERVDSFSVGGKPLSMEVMAAFDVNADGRIARWRDSYDLKSVADQIQAAGSAATT